MAKQISLYEVLHENIIKTFKHFGSFILAMGVMFITGVAALSLAAVMNMKILVGLKALWPQMYALSKCTGPQCNEMAANLVMAIMMLMVANIWWIVAAIIFVGIIAAMLNLGFAKFTLSIHDKKTASIRELFPSIGQVFKYIIAGLIFCTLVFGASLIMAIIGFWLGLHFAIIGIGATLFFIPGIYLAIRLGLFNFAIIDRNAGVFESLSQSWELTKGHSLLLLSLIMINTLANWIGALIYIGFLITWPFAVLNIACIYRKLAGGHEIAADVAQIPQPPL